MKKILAISLLSLLGACTQLVPPPREPSAGHIKPETSPPAAAAPIPKVVEEAPVLPPPQPEAPQGERYTVVVNEVPVKELLFAIARDANMNVDINPGVSGVVTLNAVQQTLPQILNRISEQADIRYEIKADRISVMPDLPFSRTYAVNYINMSRDVTSKTQVATQIDTSTDTTAGGRSSSGGASQNNSTTSISSTSNQRFWESLTANILSILGQVEAANSIAQERIEESTAQSSGDLLGFDRDTQRTSRTIERSSGLPASDRVIVNRESGLMTVVATGRQHAEIQKFLDQVMANVSRQVLVEATIVEVRLTDQYQAGIDWAAIAGDFALAAGLTAGALPGTITLGTPGNLPISSTASPFSAFTFAGDNFNLGIRLLQQFGNVQVLSSPKAMVLNNQTAVLKVVDNQVFFTIEADTTQNTNQTTTTVTTTPHSVAVGLVMNVTPQINADDTVMLNVRPTISRINGFAIDPNPAPITVGLPANQIPIIQTRELESLLKVPSGQTAVLGGLMQDSVDIATDGTPGLQNIPGVGELFKYRNNQYAKSELVIFLRPTVIKNPGLNGDFKDYNQYLSPVPDQGFPPPLDGREPPCYRDEPGCDQNRVCQGDWCQ
jgi:general secretion pathway protein D